MDKWNVLGPLLQSDNLVAKTYNQNLSIDCNLLPDEVNFPPIYHRSKSFKVRLFTHERFRSRRGHTGDEPSRNLPILSPGSG